MFAASLLVVAVVATYASLAVISLTGAGPGSVHLSTLPGSVFKRLESTVGWQAPPVNKVFHVRSSRTAQIRPFGDTPFLDLGSYSGVGSTTRQFSLTNTSSATLPLTLSVHASSGISAQFADTGGDQTVVHPRAAARINVTTDAAHAGRITGTLTVAIANSRVGAYTVQLTGAQAPYPVSSLTATPIAHGAVHLAWAPSRSSGVTGYLLQRSSGAGGAWTTVGALPATATSAVDHTPADGTYAYRVIAAAGGATLSAPPVESSPGPSATAVADTQAPDAPGDVAAPQFISAATGDDVVLNVTPGADSEPTDTITVTLTDASGRTVSGDALAVGSAVPVKVSGVDSLAQGKIVVTATATDSVGNTSNPFTGQSIWKDTLVPAVPTLSVPPINGRLDVHAVPVRVNTEKAAADGTVVNVTMSDGTNIATGVGNENAGDDSVVVPVNASGLADTPNPDEGITVTATVTDEAGNTSQPGTAVTGKDTTGPAVPNSIGVLGGSDNPPGVVTEASQNAVMVQATFDQAPSPDDQFVIWVAGKAYGVTADGQSPSLSLGPLDLSGLPDGTYKLGIKETDPSGNVSGKWGWTFVKDTGGAEAPTGVGVPAGPENPAGYVNAATQTAATIVATFAGPTDPADQITLSVGGLTLPTQSGGDDELSWTADLSSLPDGTLPITGTIIDRNGVKSAFTGSLVKDTEAPPAPAVASVVGPPPNTITQSGASCVKVFVAFNQAPDPNDTVTVTLSDGSSSARGSASAGDGHVTVGCIDATSLSAGQISVSVTVTDSAGNSTDFTGTPAVLLACHHGGQDDGGSQSPDR
jgi:large repetitive protein